MFLALGLPWIFECLHYSTHGDHLGMGDYCHSATEIIFRILSIVNYCRGIILFLIFVCKRNVWIKLRRTEPFRRVASTLARRNKRAEFVLSGETFVSLSTIGDGAKR